MELSNYNQELLDEILEIMWTRLEEAGAESVPVYEIVVGGEPAPEEALAALREEGFLTRSDQTVALTDTGFVEARRTIRRHRLSERMFSDILDIPHDEMESAACRFEHMLIKPELEEKICGLLGHPRTCPHGRPVPIGDCCHRAAEQVDQAVVAMSELRQGEDGVIAYVQSGESDKLKKLMSMGILPGEQIHLERRYPSFVFSVGYSRYAVDEGMARAIYVRRSAAETPPADPEPGL